LPPEKVSAEKFYPEKLPHEKSPTKLIQDNSARLNEQIKSLQEQNRNLQNEVSYYIDEKKVLQSQIDEKSALEREVKSLTS
jgi:predicted RNase H-like nuclease (RuvC/YqgF family)